MFALYLIYIVALCLVVCSAKDIVITCHGSEITSEWFSENGFKTPIVVDVPEGLGLIVPSSDFTVADVEHYVG